MNVFLFNRRPIQRRRLFILLTMLALGVFAPSSHAHQEPTTIMMLDVGSDKVALELQIPLSELELAFGRDVNENADTLVEKISPRSSEYLLAHSPDDR